LGEVLRQRKEFIDIDDLVTYKRCRVQLHTKGIVLRDEVCGALIKTKRQQVCREGEFLVAEIDAKVGGFGIVPKGLGGAIVSSHYFLFELDVTQLDARFLEFFSKTHTFRDQVSAQGSTNYAAIRPQDVLDYIMPLPTLDEQGRIVARLETIASKAKEAASLTTETAEASVALCRGILASDDETRLPMRELVTLREPDVSVQTDATYAFAGVLCFGRGVFASQTRAGSEFAYRKLTTLRPGDLVYPKLMAWEGAFAVVPEELAGRVVSPEFPVFEVNTEMIFPEVLDVYFRTPSVWAEVAGKSTGTNVRRRRLNPRDFLNYRMPVPARRTQEQLRAVYRRVQVLQRLRDDNLKRFQSLLPAFLKRLFDASS
jgi:type I restriction enzyme S subunit